MILEGKNSVYEAIVAGNKIEKIVFINGQDDGNNKILNLARQKGIKFQFVPKEALNKISKTGHHQGVIAYTEDFKYSDINELFENAKNRNQQPFFVMLDGIEDQHNFGSILRSCECAGVNGIIIPKNRSVSVNETSMRTSAGAINHLKIAKVTNLNSCIEDLKKRGVWIYALEAGGGDIYKANLNGAITIIVGSEGKGVNMLTKKLCDGIISLPLKGKINSLNASVATGIALYEALRQRK